MELEGYNEFKSMIEYKFRNYSNKLLDTRLKDYNENKNNFGIFIELLDNEYLKEFFKVFLNVNCVYKNFKLDFYYEKYYTRKYKVLYDIYKVETEIIYKEFCIPFLEEEFFTTFKETLYGFWYIFIKVIETFMKKNNFNLFEFYTLFTKKYINDIDNNSLIDIWSFLLTTFYSEKNMLLEREVSKIFLQYFNTGRCETLNLINSFSFSNEYNIHIFKKSKIFQIISNTYKDNYFNLELYELFSKSISRYCEVNKSSIISYNISINSSNLKHIELLKFISYWEKTKNNYMTHTHTHTEKNIEITEFHITFLKWKILLKDLKK